MSNVISAELFKLRKSKALSIHIAVIFGVCLLVTGTIGFVSTLEPGEAIISGLFGQLTPDAINLPFIVLDALGQLFLICLAIFTPINIIKDFDNGCVKNMIAAGRSRTAWVVAKLLNQWVASAVFVIAGTLLFTIGMSLHVGWLTPVTISYIGRLLVFMFFEIAVCFAYGALFTMLSLLIRNLGGAIGAAIGFIMLESLVSQIFSLLNLSYVQWLIQLLPIKMIERLNLIAQGLAGAGNYGVIALTVVAIAAVASALSVLMFNKRDI